MSHHPAFPRELSGNPAGVSTPAGHQRSSWDLAELEPRATCPPAAPRPSVLRQDPAEIRPGPEWRGAGATGQTSSLVRLSPRRVAGEQAVPAEDRERTAMALGPTQLLCHCRPHPPPGEPPRRSSFKESRKPTPEVWSAPAQALSSAATAPAAHCPRLGGTHTSHSAWDRPTAPCPLPALRDGGTSRGCSRIPGASPSNALHLRLHLRPTRPGGAGETIAEALESRGDTEARAAENREEAGIRPSVDVSH
ncbi:uncharacterized protein LOC119504999 isoform X2 [Choloepus didactylus]|uniref:uncharacterized protein LOC119504999 isoform X2 n=1 Tax=Choloepus didactylus TaxID=27675 RepID=UPI00189F36BA|nr:uncharacterized protein LOC119504999 isoform X2 [Choloepus didactylus]